MCCDVVQLCSWGEGPACSTSACALRWLLAAPYRLFWGPSRSAEQSWRKDQGSSRTAPADGGHGSVRRAGWEVWSLSWSRSG